MPAPLSAASLLRARARGQLLLGPRPRLSPAATARAVCGLQAQDERAGALAVRARCAGVEAADVTRARLEERSLVRAWTLRGTLHLHAADDLAWLPTAVVPPALTRTRDGQRRLGIEPAAAERAVERIAAMLADEGPLTRAEIRQRLERSGISAEGQRGIHLIRFAALRGVACQGPQRGRDAAFVAAADWLGRPSPSPSREAALVELARRHLLAFGPAAPPDLAAWSGIPVREARAAWRVLADELVEVETPIGRLWSTRSARPGPGDGAARAPEHEAGAGAANGPSGGDVRLLGAFDTYLLGYRGRAPAVPAERERSVNAGGGIIRPVLLEAGRVVASWRAERRRRTLVVELSQFGALAPAPATRAAALDEARDVARFEGLDPERVELGVAPLD